MKLATRLLNIGVTDQLIPYERRRAKVFNYCNLAGFMIALLRLVYLSRSFNHYSDTVLLVNAIPMLIAIALWILMTRNLYKAAIAVSFIFFPPALVVMAFLANDNGLEIFLFLYMLFTFFFLYKRSDILTAFSWTTICFCTIHFFLQNGLAGSPYRHDVPLSIIDYTSGLLFIFIAFYFIKFEVWKFEKSIQKKKEELKKLNAVKDKVFSVISHDLRSPINSIILLLRQMAKAPLTVEDFETYLPDILDNMEQTSDLLDNLLAWARSQIQQSELNADEISLTKLAQQTIRFLERSAANKNIRLINEVPTECFAFADESSTKIVLRNLLANAIKFTGSGGVVKVKTALQGEFINISVEDNGIGIPPNKQELLFGDVYYTSLGTNKEAGTGLGLLICKDLVQKNGGSLVFRSEVGNGSTFSFSLPLHN